MDFRAFGNGREDIIIKNRGGVLQNAPSGIKEYLSCESKKSDQKKKEKMVHSPRRWSTFLMRT